jgi:hypothetical protein
MWSRDNGSVVFPILSLAGGEATLAHLGRDDTTSLQVGDWVEPADDDSVLRGSRMQVGGVDLPLLKVTAVDPVAFKVTLQAPGGETLPSYSSENDDKHPLLRRWDHKAGEKAENVPELAGDGALLIVEDAWLALEAGVQVKFEKKLEGKTDHTYRVGDYWLIPARVATQDVEWPGPKEAPKAVPPHGVQHHYAPLAIIKSDGAIVDCRMEIDLPVKEAS